MSLRRAVVAGVGALALALSACSGDPVDDPGDPSTGAKLSGLVLLDCWRDTVAAVDPTTARVGSPSDLAVKPVDKLVTVTNACRGDDSRFGSGFSPFDDDFGRITATRSTDDGSRSVGYITAITGKFTDLSARLKLDANGELTDEGSGADEFAGPIADTTVGFGPDGSFYLERANLLFSAPPPSFTEFVKHPAGQLGGTRLDAQSPPRPSTTPTARCSRFPLVRRRSRPTAGLPTRSTPPMRRSSCPATTRPCPAAACAGSTRATCCAR